MKLLTPKQSLGIGVSNTRARSKALFRRWNRFADIFADLDNCHPDAAAFLYVIPERGIPRCLLTSNIASFQNSESYADIQHALQKHRLAGQEATPVDSSTVALQPCFSFIDRRSRITADAAGLSEIVRGKLGGSSTLHLRRLVADIKRLFPDCQLPVTTGLSLQCMMDLIQKIARPGAIPTAAQLWHALSPNFGDRHGTGPELLMIVRVLDWVALKKEEPTLAAHPLEIMDATEDAPEQSEDATANLEDHDDQHSLQYEDFWDPFRDQLHTTADLTEETTGMILYEPDLPVEHPLSLSEPHVEIEAAAVVETTSDAEREVGEATSGSYPIQNRTTRKSQRKTTSRHTTVRKTRVMLR